MNKTEFRPAWAWDCDECGRENFVRSIVKERPQGDRHVAVSMPEVVECSHCGVSFEAVFFCEGSVAGESEQLEQPNADEQGAIRAFLLGDCVLMVKLLPTGQLSRWFLATRDDRPKPTEKERADGRRVVGFLNSQIALLGAAEGLLSLMDEVPDDLPGGQSDRVFAKYEFDALVAAVRG